MSTFDNYQLETRATAIYEDAVWSTLAKSTQEQLASYLSLVYPCGKLCGEAGELNEQIMKALRDDHGVLTEERFEAIRKELGDVLWYVAQIAVQLGVSLSDIAQENLEKLQSRQDRGVLGGSGDDR